MARSAARLKMGYYPLPESEGAKLHELLTFTGPASVVDPCVGQGTALNLLIQGANVHRCGVELDAERALAASAQGIETIQGNAFDAIAKPESFSLLYLNPPYDSEIGPLANSRMERLFLEHTFRWLVIEGVLVLVIPFERLHECAGILASHFARLSIFRMTDEESVRFRQIVVLGIRRNVRGVAVEEARRQLQRISPYGSFQALAELAPEVCDPYPVPPTGEAALSYRGLPYDLLEDLLPLSGAWKQTLPFLMPREDVATGRPITPLHGGHVGLLCTAGLLNGVFGQGDDRHIARWRSVKHVTTFVEENGNEQIIHHRERWANELRLVYADGRTLKLTETPAKPEGETDAECTPEARVTRGWTCDSVRYRCIYAHVPDDGFMLFVTASSKVNSLEDLGLSVSSDPKAAKRVRRFFASHLMMAKGRVVDAVPADGNLGMSYPWRHGHQWHG